MSRRVLIVDGGYFCAVESELLKSDQVDIVEFMTSLENDFGPFDRRYWFQGNSLGKKTEYHQLLERHDISVKIFGTKVQQGWNSSTRQKTAITTELGVDVAIGVKIVEVAYRHTPSNIVLITGDGDLFPAVQFAKTYVTVEVIASPSSLSHLLNPYAAKTNGTTVVKLTDLMWKCSKKSMPNNEYVEKRILAENQLSEATSDISLLQNQLGLSQTESANLNVEVGRLTAEKEQMKVQIDSLNAEITLLKTEMTGKDETIAKLFSLPLVQSMHDNHGLNHYFVSLSNLPKYAEKAAKLICNYCSDENDTQLAVVFCVPCFFKFMPETCSVCLSQECRQRHMADPHDKSRRHKVS